MGDSANTSTRISSGVGPVADSSQEASSTVGRSITKGDGDHSFASHPTLPGTNVGGTDLSARLKDCIATMNPKGAHNLLAGGINSIRAREMYAGLAEEVAASCFDGEGKINADRVAAWCNLLANEDNFQGDPYDGFPCFEHMRSQMYAVLNGLQTSNKFVKILNDANGEMSLHPQGEAFMEATFPNMKPGQAILVSLLSPHRQKSLPTCAISSFVINATFNCPWQLAEMYASALANWEFHTPSEYQVSLPPFENGYVPVDLQRGGEEGIKCVFKNINSLDQKKIDDQIEEWKMEGISYNPEIPNTLNMPMRNLTDLWVASLFQATFGNSEINKSGGYGTRKVLAGFSDADSFYPGIYVGEDGNAPKIPELMKKAIRELQKKAQMYQKKGMRYMQISSHRPGDSGYTENIDIARLLALDLKQMKNEHVHWIGNSNYSDEYNIDSVRLAIKKTMTERGISYQLGEAYHMEHQGATKHFIKKDFYGLWVHKDIVPPPKPKQTRHV
jgi:hypothetical protein